MMRIAVVTDSTSYLSPEYVRDHDVHVLPLFVITASGSYREGVDLSNEEFYSLLRQCQELPTTSQPGLGTTVKLFERLAAEGCDEVICVHLSSGISGTYATTLTAGTMVPGLKVHVFDSELSTAVQGCYVQEAVRMVEAGCSAEVVMVSLEELKGRMRAFFVVDDLNNLYKGGRLPRLASTVGSALQIKPILHFRDRKIVPYELVRTKRRAVNRILEMFADDVQMGQPIRATVVHGHVPDEASAMVEAIRALCPHDNVEVLVSEIGPVIGTHLGEGALGLGWYTK